NQRAAGVTLKRKDKVRDLDAAKCSQPGQNRHFSEDRRIIVLRDGAADSFDPQGELRREGVEAHHNHGGLRGRIFFHLFSRSRFAVEAANLICSINDRAMSSWSRRGGRSVPRSVFTRLNEKPEANKCGASGLYPGKSQNTVFVEQQHRQRHLYDKAHYPDDKLEPRNTKRRQE